jgi:regulatory protein
LKVITDIRPQKSRRRWNIFLDGQFAFPVAAEMALKAGLKVGQRLEPSQVEALTSAQTAQSCLEVALRYLNYRPRSEQELRQRLSQRGFDQETIAQAIQRLKEMGQVNNLAFAQFWVENRQSFRPRSRLRLRQELQVKGVERETIETVVSGLDDEENAYLVARKKQTAWAGSDAQAWRRRMGAYLSRRGFSYGVIKDALKRLAGDSLESARLDRGQLSK